MDKAKELYFEKRGQLLVKNLKKRHFDAAYCKTTEDALQQALAWIPEGASVGWGGALSAQQIGLMDAVRAGNYRAIDRDLCETAEQREQAAKDCMFADVFLTGANALSMDGEMVNIDGTGNRLAAICYGAKQVVVVVGMNKVTNSLETAIARARDVAAPMNEQRFDFPTPCNTTGTCADCKSERCICNQILITRNGRGDRIKFILVGEDLGL